MNRTRTLAGTSKMHLGNSVAMLTYLLQLLNPRPHESSLICIVSCTCIIQTIRNVNVSALDCIDDQVGVVHNPSEG